MGTGVRGWKTDAPGGIGAAADGEAIIEQSHAITNPPAPTPPPRWRWPVLLMTLAAVYYVAGVLTLATHRRGEVEPVLFARLLATGHMAEFVETAEQRRPPTDQWVHADAWQRFERLEDRWVFRRIAQDSGRYEAHPPFFFWLMHVALCLGAPDHWVTTIFNLPAAVLTGGLVAALAWRVTRDAWTAALAATCWFLSPPVMLIGDSVRSPTLFAPLTLLLIWLTLDWALGASGRTSVPFSGRAGEAWPGRQRLASEAAKRGD